MPGPRPPGLEPPDPTPDARGPLLEAEGLGRRRAEGGDWLLRDVRVAIRPGDRVAVLGPSGAGKTLLLRGLALLDPPDEGVVRWQGREVRAEDVPDFRGAVIYLPQRAALFEGSVEDNLRLPFTLRTHRRGSFDRDRIVALLDGLGRGDAFLGKSHRDLSGGEAQIVALLRVIQLGPSVVLLDEPTASLDRDAAQAVERLIGLWYAESAGDRAYIWVTHDPEQAGRVTDQALRMKAGRLGV